MPPKIPDILPGEIYQGWLERFRILNNYENMQRVYRELRAMALIINDSATEHLHEIGAIVTDTDYSDFIEQHTLVPFLQLSNKSHYFQKGRWVASPWNYHSDSVSRIHSEGKKCIECEDADLRNQGFRYLRRDHQIPGVEWCLFHQSHLVWNSPEGRGSFESFDDPDSFTALKAQVFKIMYGLN
ncbi:TniQ protein [Polaromonas sp. OV174]|uniref:TniQ family protein n=1 Tax=Polaromonas sp. OV174 TaxID=1855300 RepID=UPI0008EA9383|nr:TniQ family protein [Polaromonas sp. OV174]SFB90118.1 TniQ protein [Polaromonas sp. OV174]